MNIVSQDLNLDPPEFRRNVSKEILKFQFWHSVNPEIVLQNLGHSNKNFANFVMSQKNCQNSNEIKHLVIALSVNVDFVHKS